MLVVQSMKAYRFASRALPSRAKGVGLGSLWTALRESISLRCLCGASSNSRLAVMSWRTSTRSTALLLNSRSISFSLMCPAGQLSHHSHPTPLLTSTLLPRPPVFPLTRTPFLLPPHLRLFQTRLYSSLSDANKSTARYFIAVAIVVVGLSYAAVPLYRLYCQASGYGGTVSVVDAGEKVEKMVPVREREITIRFNADVSAGMRWNFKPQQKDIKIVPGETALAFYTARNPTEKPVTGISTYNVVPFEAGQYFNKIQCFCFEEQILNPNEQVDMPVFFYIDPEFNDDPSMARVTTITLSYTFFEAKEGESIYLPVPQKHQL